LEFPSTAPSLMDIVPLHHSSPSMQGSPSPNQPRPHVNSSPISVINPFDIYSSLPAGTQSRKVHFFQPHQQRPYHATMNHYSPSSPRMNGVWPAQQQQQQHFFQHQHWQHQQFPSTATQPYASQPSVYAGH
jgi:hypothetical protein